MDLGRYWPETDRALVGTTKFQHPVCTRERDPPRLTVWSLCFPCSHKGVGGRSHPGPAHTPLVPQDHQMGHWGLWTFSSTPRYWGEWGGGIQILTFPSDLPLLSRITNSTWRWHRGQRGSCPGPSCPTSPCEPWHCVSPWEWAWSLTVWPWMSYFRDLSFPICRIGVMVVATS